MVRQPGDEWGLMRRATVGQSFLCGTQDRVEQSRTVTECSMSPRFCGECLQPCLQVTSPLCPLCRLPFDPKKVDKAVHVEKQLSAYKAPCRGCNKKVPAGDWGAVTLPCSTPPCCAPHSLPPLGSWPTGTCEELSPPHLGLACQPTPASRRPNASLWPASAVCECCCSSVWPNAALLPEISPPSPSHLPLLGPCRACSLLQHLTSR